MRQFQSYTLKVAVVVSLLAVTMTMASAPAYAVDKIYSPNVTKGEWELEYFGTRTFDGNHDKNDEQEHEVSIGYGVTNHWATELYGLFDKQIDESLRMSGVQFEKPFQPV